MDLQTRKLNLITYLAQLQDEPFFDKIEEYILSRSEKADCSDFVPFTIETLTRRLETYEEDFKNGRYSTQEDLENQSSNW